MQIGESFVVWNENPVNPAIARGPAYPSNMQWQTVADAKIKDADEQRQ